MDEETAESVRYSRRPMFHWELTNTFEQIDFQVRFLTGLIHRLAQQIDNLENSHIHILRSLNDVADYIYKNEGDYILLTSPEYMPLVFKSRDIGWVKDAHDFANWLMVNWRDESLVIALL